MATVTVTDLTRAGLEQRLGINQVLALIDQFPPEDQLRIRRHLEENWAEKLGALFDRVQSRVPDTISEQEVMNDVAEAIRDVRAGK